MDIKWGMFRRTDALSCLLNMYLTLQWIADKCYLHVLRFLKEIDVSGFRESGARLIYPHRPWYNGERLHSRWTLFKDFPMYVDRIIFKDVFRASYCDFFEILFFVQYTTLPFWWFGKFCSWKTRCFSVENLDCKELIFTWRHCWFRLRRPTVVVLACMVRYSIGAPSLS